MRAVIATDFSSLDYVGWVVLPALWLEACEAVGGWDLNLGIGPIFADASYHDHFYGGAPEFAMPQRPAYDVEGGYSGAGILFGGSRRYRKFWLGAFVRYDNLSGTAFEDSPLFKSEHALSAGFGVAWIFGRSETLVEAKE